jgi:hypothetical protein
VSQDVRTALTTLAKPSVLRSTPVTVQIVVLMSLAGLALKRPELAQAMVSTLLQAVESVKNAGMDFQRYHLEWVCYCWPTLRKW